MNRETMIELIESSRTGDRGVQFLQCGSSIHHSAARDIDIIAYVSCDLASFFEAFTTQFAEKNILRKRYIDVWRMYSFKISENSEVISFHFVSFGDLKGYVEKAGEPETYTEINLFSLSMKLPSVYRKWIIDTRHLCGDSLLKEELLTSLRQQSMPSGAIQDMLKGRILNSIQYYYEKSDSELFSGVVLCQIFNDIVLYCYAGNEAYFGTLKYLEEDIKSFSRCAELSETGIKLYQTINRQDRKKQEILLRQAQELLCVR